MDLTGHSLRVEETNIYNTMAFQNELDIQRGRDIQRAINRRVRFLEQMRRRRQITPVQEDETGTTIKANNLSRDELDDLDIDENNLRRTINEGMLNRARTELINAREFSNISGERYFREQIDEINARLETDEAIRQALPETTGFTD